MFSMLAPSKLEPEIRQWIRSEGPATNPDKLIELRIALEALYDVGGVPCIKIEEQSGLTCQIN